MLLQQKLLISLKLVQKYEWLLNAYMLDFYLDDHWSKLPPSWRTALEQLNHLEQLSDLLQNTNQKSSTPQIWPLELLALRQMLKMLCITRTPRVPPQVDCPLLEHPKLKYLFRKCVKPKKLHEITRMSAICTQHQPPVDFVVDFGAGVGHLARLLGYGCGIQVCCLEMQSALNEQAKVIDAQMESMAQKHLPPSEMKHFKRPVHLTQRLTSSTQPAEFLKSLREALGLSTDNFQFGLIGLHPCGDLAPTLMRMFLACKQAKWINFVSCCYQKMTTHQTHPQAKHPGYPLSAFLQSQSFNQLSYESREISCHAVEMYQDRLSRGEYEYLKIHSLRAAAERVIVQEFPLLRHCALRNVKHHPGLSFVEYFQRAVQGTRFETLETALDSEQTERDLLNWPRIVSFYTLRLMLAPLVESIMLYDRQLFLMEQDCQVHIEAIFEARLSPRNHITQATKS